MKEITCCFTGHRNIPPSEIPAVMAKTEMLVRSLIQKGVKYYGVGGAVGFDYEKRKIMRSKTLDAA